MSNTGNQQNQVSSLGARRVGIEVITVIFLEKNIEAAKLEASKNGNNRFDKESSKEESDMIYYRI